MLLLGVVPLVRGQQSTLGSASSSRLGTNRVTVSAKGIANGLSLIFNDGAMFGPDTSGTATYGIQEAVNSLPNFPTLNNVPGGGKILLGPGTFYTSQSITNPNPATSNVFSLAIEGDGFESTALVGMGATNGVIFITNNWAGQLMTFDISDMTLASTNFLPSILLNIQCQQSGLQRGSVRRCGFAQWTRITNAFANVVGGFTFSVGPSPDSLPNNLVAININNGPSETFSVEHNHFAYVLGNFLAIGNSPILTDNAFLYCGSTALCGTNQWPFTDPRYAATCNYLGEQFPYPGFNVGGKWYYINNNQYIGCSNLYYFRDNFAGSYGRTAPIYNDRYEANNAIVPSIILDGAFSLGGSTNLTTTLVNPRGDNAGAPYQYAAYVVTNSSDYRFAKNVRNDSMINYVDMQTNGMFVSGRVYAGSLAASGASASLIVGNQGAADSFRWYRTGVNPAITHLDGNGDGLDLIKFTAPFGTPFIIASDYTFANTSADPQFSTFSNPFRFFGTNSYYSGQFTNAAVFNYSNAWLTATNSRKTNLARRGTFEADFKFVDVVGGVPLLEVTVEDLAGNITNVWTCQVPGGLAATITNHYSFKVPPSGVVSITNKSSGSSGDAFIAQSRMVWE